MDRRIISTVVLITVAAGYLFAETAPELPPSPDQWINTVPLTKENTRGKAVFLWFFEET